MAESQPIRVMIVDEHDMVRRGLATFLRISEDLELVAEAHDGQEALELCERLQPDVVLMDLRMPQMDGVTATGIIRQHWPHVHVIALTSFDDRELVQEVLDAGAFGYLLKNVTVDQLATAIRRAHVGQITLAPEAAQALRKPADHDD